MEGMLQEVARSLVVALAPIIAALITAYLTKMLQRIGLEVQAEQQAKMEKTVQDIVLRVEELAAKQKKTDPSAPAQSKLSVAVGLLLEQYPKLTGETARDLIHQELPKLRLGIGAAATERVSG